MIVIILNPKRDPAQAYQWSLALRSFAFPSRVYQQAAHLPTGHPDLPETVPLTRQQLKEHLYSEALF